MPADKLNILICSFMIDIRRKDGDAFEPTAFAFREVRHNKFLESPSYLISYHITKKEKMAF